MERDYGGVIWTNHALQRMRERGIGQSDAWAAFSRPDHSRFAQSKGAWVYDRSWGKQKIEIVAKKNEVGKWIILSVWGKQVFGKEEKSIGFFGKLFKRLFGK